jgi:hypothetical protein
MGTQTNIGTAAQQPHLPRSADARLGQGQAGSGQGAVVGGQGTQGSTRPQGPAPVTQGNGHSGTGTPTAEAAQHPRTVAEVPNTEAYSSNFYFDLDVEGQTFSAQMTVRGGINGLDHIDRLIAAMKKIVEKGGVPKTRGRQQEAAAPSAGAAEKWEWDKGERGRDVLVLRGESPEPDAVPCPKHPGKNFKRKWNDDGAWLSHKDANSPGGYCSAGFKRIA